MIERGARHFIFMSRSGADKPEAARVVAGIERMPHASAQVFRVDVADSSAVCDVVAKIVEKGRLNERPVRGVIHAAMVLEVRLATLSSFCGRAPGF